jgi:phosphoribosylformimino-5-aminoimidazole carboxamide ribonucleotide (ProFAR) isomerase
VRLFAAIDLMDGRAVRLVRGRPEDLVDFGRAEEAAARLAGLGYRCFHVVDLRAAISGERPDTHTIAKVLRELPGSEIQVGGGIRDISAAEELASMREGAVSRIVVSTAALADRRFLEGLLERLPGKVAVSLDVAGDRVLAKGWRAPVATLEEALSFLPLARLAALVVTSTRVDGTLKGPDLGIYRRVLARVEEVPVIAAGGIGRIEHLEALASLEVGGRALYGAVAGMAVHAGTIDAREALKVCGD